MRSPTISFRLSNHQLARGLACILRLEPKYRASSIHAMVKMVFIDYCAKMDMGYSSEIAPNVWHELEKILPGCRKKPAGSDKKVLMRLDKLAMLNGNIPMSAPFDTKVELPTNEYQPTNVSRPKPVSNARPSGLTEDIATESESSTITDFSFLKTLAGEEEDNNE